MQQVRWLTRAWSRGPGRTAMREVYSSYVFLMLVVCVVFGGNGLQPRTVVSFVRTTPSGGMLLLLAWVALSSRAYRAARSDSAWPLLRTFPLSFGALASVGFGFVLLVESPWLVLWMVGGGVGHAVVALCGSLVVSGCWIWVTERVRLRFVSPRLVRAPFALATLAWLRTLVRQYTLAFFAGTVVWACVTAVILAMLQRPHESVQTRRDFGIALTSSLVLLTATTNRWLIHQEERRSRWVFTVCRHGKRLMVLAPVVTVLGVSLAFGLGACGVAVGRAGLEVAPFDSVALPLLGMTTCFGLGFGLLAVAMQGRWLRGAKPIDALVKALMLVVPWLVLALHSNTVTAILLAFFGGVSGVVLLHREASDESWHERTEVKL